MIPKGVQYFLSWLNVVTKPQYKVKHKTVYKVQAFVSLININFYSPKHRKGLTHLAVLHFPRSWEPGVEPDLHQLPIFK